MRPPEYHKELTNEIKDIFNLYDPDNKGYIEVSHLKTILRALCMNKSVRTIFNIVVARNPTEEELTGYISKYILPKGMSADDVVRIVEV